MTPARLAAIRRRLKLSQSKLAELLGVSQPTLSRWEAGVLAIEHPELLRLALERLTQERTAP